MTPREGHLLNRYVCRAAAAICLLAGAGSSASAGDSAYYFKMAFVMKNNSNVTAYAGVQNVRFQNLGPGTEMRVDTELRAAGERSGQRIYEADYEINPSEKYCRVRIIVNYATPDGAANCQTWVTSERPGFRCSAVGRVENKGCMIETYLVNGGR